MVELMRAPFASTLDLMTQPEDGSSSAHDSGKYMFLLDLLLIVKVMRERRLLKARKRSKNLFLEKWMKPPSLTGLKQRRYA